MKVEYMTHSGTDLTVVNAARASFGKESDWDISGYEEVIDEESRVVEHHPVKVLKEKDVRLIDYLAREKHVLPFRHPQITLRCKAPIFLARQLGKHQVGMCLTGDTKVTFVRMVNGRSNGIRETSMEDLWRMWDGQIKYQGGDKGRRNVSGSHVRVFNEDSQRFETSHIKNVIFSGKKDVYELTTIEGLSVKASADHDILTTHGWKKLKDIECGDYVVSDREGISYGHTTPPERGKDRFARSRFWKQSDKFCAKCGSAEQLEVSHIEPVWRAPEIACDFSNMELLCHDCHVEKDSSDRKKVSNLLPKAGEVISIDYVGEVDTYDLSIDRIHNFVANGIVVHNSWSEESRRYITTEPEFYWPDKWRKKADNVKQGSSDEEFVGSDEDNPLTIVETCVDWYNRMLEQGMAPELARMILPQNMYVVWVWTGSLLSFYQLYKLRSEAHAQREAQQFAEMIKAEVSKLYPESWAALERHI